jgi:hypothetical protein
MMISTGLDRAALRQSRLEILIMACSAPGSQIEWIRPGSAGSSARSVLHGTGDRTGWTS